MSLISLPGHKKGLPACIPLTSTHRISGQDDQSQWCRQAAQTESPVNPLALYGFQTQFFNPIIRSVATENTAIDICLLYTTILCWGLLNG